MKAARIIEFNKPLVIEEVPDPTPGPEDVVIRVEATGICRSDWHLWQGDFSWLGMSPELPRIPGHEFGGEIVEVGENIKNFKIGDKVTAPFHSGCGHCDYCSSARSNLCENIFLYGTIADGSYSEYLLIENADFNLVRLPENIDTLTAAAIGCRFMTGYHGVVRSNVQPGEWLAVQGAGGVGLSAIQTARALGAQVIAVDIDDEKLEIAKDEGADAVVNASNENVPEAIQEITKGGAHVGIDALGVKDTILNSIHSLRKGGRHVQIGLTGAAESGQVEIPIDLVTITEIEIVGSLGNPHSDYPNLLSLISSGRVNPKSLLEKEVSLDEVNNVFNKMSNFETKGLNVITSF